MDKTKNEVVVSEKKLKFETLALHRILADVSYKTR